VGFQATSGNTGSSAAAVRFLEIPPPLGEGKNMQLEKVTSRSGQAALAGWISSNDVTLFTTVLVMAIAMFLHARLSKGAKENVQISEKNAALSQDLATTASARDASNRLLDESRKSLELTASERDRIQQQLADKLADISRLNAKL